MKRRNNNGTTSILVLMIAVVLIAVVSSSRNHSAKNYDAPDAMPPALIEFLAVTHGEEGCTLAWEGRARGVGIPKYYYAVSCGVEYRFAECHYYDNSLHCYPLQVKIR